MKKLSIISFLAIALLMAVRTQVFASDWDKAGKVLTVIEGMRVITGGKVDVIGTITGINKPDSREQYREYGNARENRKHQYYAYQKHSYPAYEHYRSYSHYRQVWVPHMVWKEKYIPRHTEYRPGYGEIVVEGHLERYLVEDGGHWERIYDCD